MTGIHPIFAILGSVETTSITVILLTLLIARNLQGDTETVERWRRSKPELVLPWIAGILAAVLFVILWDLITS